MAGRVEKVNKGQTLEYSSERLKIPLFKKLSIEWLKEMIRSKSPKEPWGWNKRRPQVRRALHQAQTLNDREIRNPILSFRIYWTQRFPLTFETYLVSQKGKKWYQPLRGYCQALEAEVWDLSYSQRGYTKSFTNVPKTFASLKCSIHRQQPYDFRMHGVRSASVMSMDWIYFWIG